MAISYLDDKQVSGSELISLYREAGWGLLEQRDPQRIEAAIRGASHFFTARDGARLVGYLMALADGALYAHVSELMVLDDWLQRGVVDGLLQQLLEALPEAERITAFAEPEHQASFARAGFDTAHGGVLLLRS